MSEIEEKVLPDEVCLISCGDLIDRSIESSVRHLVVKSTVDPSTRSFTSERPVIYKRDKIGAFIEFDIDIEGGLDDTPPLTKEEAIEAARNRMDQYANYLTCYGPNNVTGTLITVGTDQSADKRPQVHIFQRPVVVAQLPSFPDDGAFFNGYLIQNIRNKAFSELDHSSSDPRERYMRDWIEKHQKALQDFYPSYLEGILLGLHPDPKILLDYFGSDHPEAGILFSGNAGIYTNPNGVEHFQLFDFGYPRLDVLTLDSRRRLRSLIDQNKLKGGLSIQGDNQLAVWYKEALEAELALSLETKSPIFRRAGTKVNKYRVEGYFKGDITDRRPLINAILEDIEIAVGAKNAPETTEEAKVGFELESFRKLVNAQPYTSI